MKRPGDMAIIAVSTAGIGVASAPFVTGVTFANDGGLST
jgi:hypothetical protein